MFTMEFATDNAAFEEGWGTEIAGILRKVAQRVEDGDSAGAVMDSNGNTVGQWELT
jgi:hypothetical protein